MFKLAAAFLLDDIREVFEFVRSSTYELVDVDELRNVSLKGGLNLIGVFSVLLQFVLFALLFSLFHHSQ
jgi:hypothetical protein